MLVRILSSIVALPILFFFVLKGGLFLEVAAAIISIIAILEFFNAIKKQHKPFVLPTVVLLIGFYITYHQEWFIVLSGLVTLYVAYLLAVYVFDEKRSISDVGITLVGAAYIMFFFYHVILLSNLKDAWMIWFIFIVSWGADTGAYFIGVNFGKHKLVPKVSPAKSVEGAVAGVITAIIMSVILAYFFDKSFMIYSVVIGLFGSLISVTGDLVASKIKREVGVKDYGHIMPGHGGVMDRFDSLLLVTPFVYYIIQLLLFIK